MLVVTNLMIFCKICIEKFAKNNLTAVRRKINDEKPGERSSALSSELEADIYITNFMLNNRMTSS